MQRAAARAASLAIRHFASSASRQTAVASLLPGTAVLNAGTRLSVQPTAAAAAAALCAQRGHASGASKTKVAVSNEEEDNEFEDMCSDEEFDSDFDDPYDGWPICKPIGESSDDEWELNDPKNKWSCRLVSRSASPPSDDECELNDPKNKRS